MKEGGVNWQPRVVLANINVQHPVEACHAALFSGNDERVTQFFKSQPNLGRLLNSFTDAFKRPQHPSVIAMPDNVPPSYRNGRAISSFRDLLALSTIPINRAQAINARHGIFAPLFSNSFDFYPWMLGSDHKWLVALTPALTALDEPQEFAGQTSPEVPALVLDYFDDPLLQALTVCWERRFETTTPESRDRALFRSLNTAYEAARAPFITAGDTYDLARLVALWVSAFEILAHPGVQNVNKSHVMGMLAGNRFTTPRPQLDREDRKIRQALCERLYQVRHDYLHGNPVDDALLKHPDDAVNLTFYAALLYRIMLTEFLELYFTVPNFARTEPNWEKKFGAAIARHSHLTGYQKTIEEALRTFPL